MSKESLQITICGDICPTKDTEYLFASNNVNGLFNNVLPHFEKSDLLISNLEFPITNKCDGIKKAGPVLYGKSSFINIFKKANFNILGLANNHIKDCGEEGVLNTLDTCKKNNIKTVGAGKNSNEASKPLIIEKNGWKIGVFAFAEHEFNAAYENEAGANLLDIYEDFDAIKKLKEEVDYLVVLYHGGIEYHKYPSPLLQKKCRKIIDSGADLVACQHSHCIGTTEEYNSGNIVYGQGNTVFGYREHDKSWNEGLLIDIALNKKGSEVHFLPIETSKDGSISLMEKESATKRLALLKEDSFMINEKQFINDKWDEFCESKKSLYMPYLFGFNLFAIRVNRILKNMLVDTFYSFRRKQTTSNIIRCESHNEVISTILKNNKSK